MIKNTRKNNGKEKRIVTRVEWPLYDALVARAAKEQRPLTQLVRLILWEWAGKAAK